MFLIKFNFASIWRLAFEFLMVVLGVFNFIFPYNLLLKMLGGKNFVNILFYRNSIYTITVSNLLLIFHITFYQKNLKSKTLIYTLRI